MISQNTSLGFDQMRAAIVGGHDIANAFAELMGMAATAKDMSVMQGGFACLLACLRLIETHMSIDGVLPGSPMAGWGSVAIARLFDGLLAPFIGTRQGQQRRRT